MKIRLFVRYNNYLVNIGYTGNSSNKLPLYFIVRILFYGAISDWKTTNTFLLSFQLFHLVHFSSK